MSILSSIPFWIIAIIMMGILILVHETGHYITGRLFKFAIDEFSIGMGPAIVQKEKNNIKYSLRAIPMGGFVAFHGEDGDDDDPRAMNNMPWYKRAVVMFAGAGFNIIFAFLLTAILVCATGYYAPKLASVNENAPVCQVAEVGDVIYKVNGKRIISVGQFSEEVDKIGKDEAVTFTVKRNGETVEYTTQKYLNEDGEYKVGITYGYSVVKQNFFQAFGYSFRYNVWMTKTMYKTLWQLVTGELGTDDLTGPISTIGSVGGLVKEVAQEEELTASQRFRETLIMITELLVIISMNLAIMNLLPFPALDGFRLLFALIEGITKKHLPRKAEGIINTAGLIFLVGLMVVLEVSKLF